MKKVLILVYNFPPQLTVAARRVAKFVKYLKEFGWQPIVVTVKNSPLKKSDFMLLEELGPEVEVHKTYDLFALSRLKRKYVTKARLSMPEQKKSNFISYLLNRIILKIFRNLLIDDSNRIGWFPLTYLKCKKLIKKHKIDLILTNSLPYSSHLLGLLLSKKYKLPWIADLREGWIFDKSLSIYDSTLSLALSKWLCRKTVTNAQNLILPTPGMADCFRQGFCPAQAKIKYFPTGYDESDFANRPEPQTKKNNKFTITYTGYFYSDLQLEYFCRAVRLLLDERPALADNLRVVFFSNLSQASARYQIIERYNLTKVVELYPILPRKQYIDYIMAADVLLFIHVSTPWSKVRLGTKTFDYIRSGKFILALVPPDGGVASLIRETKSGTAIDLCETNQIKDALSELYDKYQAGNLRLDPDHALIDKYAVKNIVKKLASLFDEKVGPPCN